MTALVASAEGRTSTFSLTVGRGYAASQINFLVDLKQKQNSVMDAQESLKMTKETTQQGRTVLVFTLTTIIFVRLSPVSAARDETNCFAAASVVLG